MSAIERLLDWYRHIRHDRAVGVDVSKWQGEMDWAKTARVADFAFIRAGSISTTGSLYTDSRFEENARNCPLPHGFYWYFRPDQDPVAQAEFFADNIKPFQYALPPVCDIEEHGGLSQDAVQKATGAFLSRLQDRTHVPPIIYTRYSFWEPYVGAPVWANQYPLWIARYSEWLDGPWSDGWGKPSSWGNWDFWQYSADGNGLGKKYGANSGAIDLNVYNGTVYDLYRKYVYVS